MTSAPDIPRRVYLDHHATTPVDPRVVEMMLPYFTEKFGNPASRTHAWGWAAEEAVEQARTQTAALIGATSKEIVFTSGATEANNLAIKGVLAGYRARGEGARNHIITATTEHKAVLDACRALEKDGQAVVTYLKVSSRGEIDPADVRDAITPQTALVSLMWANNEIGTIHAIAEVGAITRERGISLHTDATQAVGTIAVDVAAMGVDLLSLSAHKIYGPKGVGALYVAAREPRVRVAPEIHGGGHERGMRSGTLNVPGIVGLGRAAEICRTARVDAAHLQSLRDRLEAGLHAGLDGLQVHGHPQRRLPGNLNLSFANIEGESLLLALPEIGLSSGSACNSTTLETSHVLRAIGVAERLAQSSLRFGVGRFTTVEDIDFTIDRVVTEVLRLRGVARGARMARRGASR